MLPVPVAIGAVAAAGSLVGDLIDQENAKKQKQNAVAAWKNLLIPFKETQERADAYGDDVYTRTMGDLNSGAFAYAGALNPETMRTLAFSKMGVARSQTETAVKEKDFGFNKSIQAKIAETEATPIPNIDVTGALGAGVAGYFGGRQLEMSASLMAAQGDYFEAMKNNIGNFNGLNKSTVKTLGIEKPLDVGMSPDYYQSEDYNKRKRKKKEFGYFSID